ncbi:MAG: peptide-methionine (R)-S-oxide reductase MsrB [Methylacidiphilales bacterium]|nr:peptide-methionine (R)-S-oxide reductase MsrB [Candidatus Methylacidiphilales bacterium]
MGFDGVIIQPPTVPANATVIWLHGLGADGNDFVSAIEELGLPNNHAIRFIFPHAPMIPVTLNHGMVMRAWFDVSGIENFFTSKTAATAAQDLLTTVNYLTTLIEQEVASGISRHAICTAGFSQGSAVVLAHALLASQPHAGVISLSGWLPFSQTPSHTNIPILLSHGEHDPVVPFVSYTRALEFFTGNSFPITTCVTQAEHTVTREQLQQCGSFINNLLQPLSAKQIEILKNHGTEPPGSSALLNEKRKGTFICAGCRKPLFRSEQKYESGTGWPSFYQSIDGALAFTDDNTHAMRRTEYHCVVCQGHQGHVFPDGPEPTGTRYCNNGLALIFIPD